MSMDEWIKLKPGDKIKWIGTRGSQKIYEVKGRYGSNDHYPDYEIFNPEGVQSVAYSRDNWALISKAKVL